MQYLEELRARVATPTGIVTAIAAVSFAYLLVLAFYRLYLAPLAKIPGPRLAALTRWYECFYDVFLPGQYTFKIKELHKQYGPIIRITPNDVHISDLAFVDQIYAPRDRNKVNQGGLMMNESLGFTSDYHLHKRRREALNPFFSQRNVEKLEPLLQDKTTQLEALFEKHLGTGEPVNLSDAYFAFANDVVRRFSFGDDNGLLRDMDSAAAQRNNLNRLLKGVHFSRHFGWLRDMVSFVLPGFIGRRLVPPGIMDILQFRANVGQKVKVILENKGDEKTDNPNTVFYELRDTPKLPDEDKSFNRLMDEATLIIMAGTGSPAHAMQIAQFYLLQNPKVLSRLRQELAHLPRPYSLRDLEATPYLGAILAEANRLSFGVTGRSYRTAPYPLKYKEYTLPTRTPISMTTLAAHTDEAVFPDPWTFDPERWLGPEGKRRHRHLLAFGKGHAICIGAQLAAAEMHLALAVAAGYDMEFFETDESDVRFQQDFQISHPKEGSLGVRAVIKGRAS